MSKLTREEKARRKALKAEISALGGIIYQNREFSNATIVAVPAVQGGKAKFAHISVSFCSKQDEFKRKRGELEAMSKFFDGFYIPIPIPDGSWCSEVVKLDELAEYLSSVMYK